MDYHRSQCMQLLQPIPALLTEVCAAEASCEGSGLRCSPARPAVVLSLLQGLQPLAQEQDSLALPGSVCLSLPVEFTGAHCN